MATRRGWRRSIGALAAVGAVAAGCTGTEAVGGSPDDPVDLGAVRLISYDSCDGLLAWFHTEATDRVGAYGLDAVGPQYSQESAGASDSSARAAASSPTAAGAAGADQSSTTNTQEPGVGEPDLVWTDGTRLVTVVTGRLEVVDLVRGAVTSSVEIADDRSSGSPVGLLVQDDHAVVIESSWGADDRPSAGPATSDAIPMPVDGAATTRLVRVDLDDAPTVVGTVTVDGQYVDARMVDGVVRTVVRTSPAELGFVYPSGGGQAAIDRAAEANREVIADSTIDDWLPTMTVAADGQEGTSARAVECSAVEHPTEFGGFDTVTVLGLDLGAGAVDPRPGAAVVADAETVYASTDALYVATVRSPGWDGDGQGTTATTEVAPEQQQVHTDVHRFSLPADGSARYEGSGSVPGTLLDQFALSEHDGDLRVATTVNPWESGPIPIEDRADVASTSPRARVSESRITVLRPDGDSLERIGEVTGLGPTEQIRGVRFAGDQGYVVTFRQTDPLYVVDLRDPTAPRVAGELKIPGYSSYLQVLDERRVLGLGQDATDRGRTTGFQESLFDVSDPATPTRVAQHVVPDAMSLAESDHHAVLWWPATGLLAVPVQQWATPGDGGGGTTGVLVTRISGTAIDAVGIVTHPDGRQAGACPPNASCLRPAIPGGASPTPIVRTLVADGRLVTVSSAGVKVSDLETLADRAWVPFA